MFSSDSHILPSPTPGPSTCPPNYYRCSSGACVMDSWVCDGYRDCADGSDEEACPSPGECWPLASPLTPAFIWRIFQGFIIGTAWPGWCPDIWNSAHWPGCFSLTEQRPMGTRNWGSSSSVISLWSSCKNRAATLLSTLAVVGPTFAFFSAGNYNGNYGEVFMRLLLLGESPVFLLASCQTFY